jgi:hypothetical protein
MEITSTTVTRTARHTTESAIYNIDYSTVDGRLDRVGVNIFRPAEGSEAETWPGSVHYDGRNVSCNLGWGEDPARLFETAIGIIAGIIETGGGAPGEDTPGNNESI